MRASPAAVAKPSLRTRVEIGPSRVAAFSPWYRRPKGSDDRGEPIPVIEGRNHSGSASWRFELGYPNMDRCLSWTVLLSSSDCCDALDKSWQKGGENTTSLSQFERVGVRFHEVRCVRMVHFTAERYRRRCRQIWKTSGRHARFDPASGKAGGINVNQDTGCCGSL